MKNLTLMFILCCNVFIISEYNTDRLIKEKNCEDNSSTFTNEYGEMFGKENSIGIIGEKNFTANGHK
ncbi:hypothetical protein JOC75_000544 [Metabacillus crassostreae]|uniref:hypothetical protein n=1 Tax=Metabacillus crassostreae TaxID=929098 RepID=UPI00195856A2|nr:hypothetical protein [Metabacillus crassostreae]MBM7602574.1 hypothetical protein [Metabacillus crassostreae]